MSKDPAKRQQSLLRPAATTAAAADSAASTVEDDDKKSPASSVASFGAQLFSLLMLLMKLKAWRAVFLLVPVALAASSVPLASLVEKMFAPGGSNRDSSSAKADQSNLQFYGTPDLTTSGHRVLLDRAAFPAEANAIADIVTQRRGGGGDGGGAATAWIKDCASESACKAEFISESDASVKAYVAYSNRTRGRASLDCMWVPKFSARCAYLHQLVNQAECKSPCTGAFGDVEFFVLEVAPNSETSGVDAGKVSKVNVTQPVSLPYSMCSRLIEKDLASFQLVMSMIIAASLGLTTLGLNFYLLIGTLSCIRSLKTDGFFQHLIRSGLSPGAYWLAIWLLTVPECVLISATYVLSNVILCPGAFAADDMISVFCYVSLFCLGFAGIAFLLELLVPPVVAIFLLLLVGAIGHIFAFFVRETIRQKAAFVLYMFPTINAQDYVNTHMTADILLRTTGKASLADKMSQHDSSLCAAWAFVILTILVAAYLDCLLRTGNGLCLPVHFPLTCRFWRPQAQKAMNEKPESPSDEAGETAAHIEPVSGVSQSIVADKIFKSYGACGKPVTVLNGLSCKIYRNHITALIGHNGAGKSTLIKILTGEETPNSGEARINGFRVTDSLDRLSLRGRISICPQFDSLCGDLSVMESVRVTLSCKGACNESELGRARAMLQRLGLGDKEDVKSTDLSGGQKRKVNTILALLGDPRVVFLDEPTSGLDPVSRRQLWQLLQEEKLGRSIVLCTQFMDEADVLADRKIFLCGGQIVCAGSSMFLKRAFGCGFTLNVSLRSKTDTAAVLKSLRQLAQLKSQFETELQLEVPADKPDALIQAVQVLESSQEIEAFGLSEASLDEIFMKLSGVGSAEVIEAFKSGQLNKFLYGDKKTEALSDGGKEMTESLKQAEKGVNPNFCQQFGALLRTNLKRQVRTKASICNRFLMPLVILAGLGLGVSNEMSSKKSASKDEEMPSEIRSQHLPFLKGEKYMPVCIHDSSNSAVAVDVNESCFKLIRPRQQVKNNDKDTMNSYLPLVLSKAKSQSLRSFLSDKATIELLSKACNGSSCYIYFASSWNLSDSNTMRSVGVGLFAEKFLDDSHDSTLQLREMHSHIAKLFQSENSTGKLTAVKPLSEFTPTQPELILFLLIFGLFPVSYLSDPIEDISSRVRAHMMSMGMTHMSYWINTFMVHWIQYTSCFAISVLLLCIWDKYRNSYFLLVCIPTFLFGTVSNQLTVYTVAAATKTKSTIVTLLCNLSAVMLPVVFVVLTYGKSPMVPVVIWLLPPVPPISILHFSLVYAVYCLDYYRVNDVSQVPNLYSNCWSISFIQQSVIAMPVHIVILCCIVCFVENAPAISAAVWRKKPPIVTADQSPPAAMDQGAQKEAERVLQSIRNPQNVLEVRHLAKTYPNGVQAVRGVTFAALAGETFGLLGANGAGKSTSMSVIVGEEAATTGECEIRVKDGAWVSGRASAAVGAVGYCPQHNPLFDCITVAEHLSLYAGIRGLPPAAVERQAAALIRGLGLQPHRDKQAGQLSGGNKRRLCLAMAMLGDPALIVIDEASTGVDPENKRFIWAAIRAMLHEQRSVMVTTHSMEEVEALCSRVGIMNRGRMIAFGTVQQLRSLHGDAYTLEVMLKRETDEKKRQRRSALKAAIASQFAGATILDEVSQSVQFYVPKRSVTRPSVALQWLSENQTKFGMQYYSLYQMSLDQVFVKLVKQYDNDAAKT